MKSVLTFLSEVSRNNNREWFAAHRSLYEASEEEFRDFAQRLLDGIAAFDASVCGLSLRDCTYRIYRDTRFSLDKTPYKTWKGVYVVRGGKKSGYAGYYVHIEPSDCFIYAGLHCPETTILRSVREEIIDNGDAIVEAIAATNGFTLVEENALKRNPKDFPPGHKHDALLRLKELGIMKRLDTDAVERGGEALIKTVLLDLQTTKPLIDILNRAVEYAYEEMM